MVCLRRERPRLSASASRVAVADALVVAPGPSAESRAATIRIVRSEIPGRVRMTFSSLTSSPSKLESNDCVETSPPSIAEKRSWTKSAVARSPLAPGVRSGASATIERAVRAASDPSNVEVATGGSSGSGTGVNENMSTTNATSAGSSAAR